MLAIAALSALAAGLAVVARSAVDGGMTAGCRAGFGSRAGSPPARGRSADGGGSCWRQAACTWLPHRRAGAEGGSLEGPTTTPRRPIMSTDTAPQTTDASLAGARAWFAANGLSRPREGRVLGGVSAAFARRYRLNRLVARLAVLTVSVVFTPLVYLGLWVLMPSET
jgi:phage shock protein C